jgi:hypothetical protein
MSERTEGARFFTLARRIPTLVGRLHDGSKVPGGPYTLTQVITAGVVAVLLWQTPGLWARFGLIGNVLVFAGLVYGAAFLAGRVPTGGRNPITWVTGVLGLTFRRRGGTRRGQVLQVNRPRRVRHRFNVMPDPAPRHH